MFKVWVTMHERDAIDRIILEELMRDSRTPVRVLAEKAAVSVGTIVNRIRHLEDKGIIKGYTINVDYKALGQDIVVITRMKIAKGRYPEVAQELVPEKNIITLYNITGEYDAVMISRFKDREALDTFLKRIQSHPYVDKTNSVLVLKASKESQLNLL
jgi:DNA-binding Lrp family transcriptional regulator